MRPVKITMSAFGSYAGVETIEFTTSDHGLFLITGDTGSGKTTIFDAMTYALYDQTSGGKRDGSMMRSQYADSDTETYVEFVFSYEERLYTVMRSPEYYRLGKRKMADGSERLVKELAKVELILPDGKSYVGKKREIDRKLEEIIGLDKDQFTQIVMLAQGDFLKLLHAESKERKKIFSQIFRTKLYYRMAEELKERAKKLYIQLEDNRKDLIREIQRIECPRESVYVKQWEEISISQMGDYKEIVKLLECILLEGKEQEKGWRSQVQELRMKLEDVNKIISSGESTNRIFTALKREQERREGLKQQEEAYKEWMQMLRTAKKAQKVKTCEENFLEAKEKMQRFMGEMELLQEKLQKEMGNFEEKEMQLRTSECRKQEEETKLVETLVKLRELLPKYTEWNAMKENLQKMMVSAEKEKKLFVDLQKQWDKQEKEEKEIIMFREKYLNSRVQQQKWEIYLENLEKETKKFLELKKGILQSEEWMKSVEDVRKRLSTQSEICRGHQREYERLYDLFLREQAGILARGLEEGAPCPVCGSKEHPKKARLSEQAPEERMVKEAQKMRDQAEADREKVQEEFRQKNTQGVLEQKRIQEEWEQLFQEEWREGGLEQIGLRLEEIKVKRQESVLKYEEVIRIIQVLEADDKRLREIKKWQEQAEASLGDTRIRYTAVEAEVRDWETKCKILEKDLPYVEEAKARAQYDKAEKGLGKLRADYVKAAEAYQKSVEKLRELEGRQKAMGNQADKSRKECDKLQSRFQSERKKQQFESEEAYRISAAIIPEIVSLEKKIQEYLRALDESKGKLKALKEQTRGKAYTELAKYSEEQIMLQNETKKAQQAQMHIYALNQKNKESYGDLKRHMEEKQGLQERYEHLNHLSRTANGNLSGSVKIDFETYVQRQYFKQIIYLANLRLSRMTNQEFILQCRDMEHLGSQGQVGLDLDVYHLVNNTVRDVRTLSGGESFMAALSMALGLSDMIQNQTGAVHLDTMFVDEGFGSLDDEARERAIEVLRELAGEKRLVGIISHVNELKEQIENKLVVTKDEKGSHVRWSI